MLNDELEIQTLVNIIFAFVFSADIYNATLAVIVTVCYEWLLVQLLENMESKMKGTCVDGTLPKLFEGRMLVRSTYYCLFGFITIYIVIS